MTPETIMQPTEPETDPQYLNKCAALLLKQKHYSSAGDLFRILLEKNITNAEALKGYGICFYRKGNHAAAKRCFLGYKKLAGETEISNFWLQVTEYQSNLLPETADQIKSMLVTHSGLGAEEQHLEEGLRALVGVSRDGTYEPLLTIRKTKP